MSTNQKATNCYAPPQRKWTKKEWLYKEYWGEVKSISEVADQTDVSYQSILRTMKDLGIPRRPRSARDCETPMDVSHIYSRGKANDDHSDSEEHSWNDVKDAAHA